MARRIRYFAILASMRTGSNLLERTLNQFPDLECHGELFNPAFVAKANATEYLGVTRAARDADPERLIERIVSHDPGVTPGFRIFRDHDPRILRRVLTDPDCARIVLTRNPLDSFVSLKIARETDQWLIGNEKRRKLARVPFDAEEFERYQAKIEAFHGQIRRSMATAGTTAMVLAYDDLKDLAVLNGAAAHVGSKSRLETVEEPIKKQNPGTLRDKLSNFDEVAPILPRYGGATVLGAAQEPARGAGVRMMVACRTRPVLFAQIPSGPDMAVLRWMHGLDGGDPDDAGFPETLAGGQALLPNMSRRELTDWLIAHPDAVYFTAVRHPLARAYEAFNRRILSTGEEAFPHIRELLAQSHDMTLPSAEAMGDGSRAALEAAGFGPAEMAAAFGKFLSFLELNLTERTATRIDGAWASQSAIVEGYGAIRPLTLIVREERLPKAGTSIRALLDLTRVRNGPLRGWRPTYPFPIEEIYSAELEALARRAYARDYGNFGFTDWQPGG
ncbi:MAG: nodulation protein NodH [Pseudomonadota bacterium]